MLLHFTLCPFIKGTRHGKIDLLLTVIRIVDFTGNKLVVSNKYHF
jgi:hypothetical protein